MGYFRGICGGGRGLCAGRRGGPQARRRSRRGGQSPPNAAPAGRLGLRPVCLRLAGGCGGGGGGKSYAEKCRGACGEPGGRRSRRAERACRPPAGGTAPKPEAWAAAPPCAPVAAQTGKSVNAPRPMFCPPWHPPAAGRPTARRTPSPAAPAPAPLRRSPAESR